jgi:hypothetical protein
MARWRDGEIPLAPALWLRHRPVDWSSDDESLLPTLDYEGENVDDELSS